MTYFRYPLHLGEWCACASHSGCDRGQYARTAPQFGRLGRGGGSTARLGGRELTLLCGFNQYTLLQNRDNSRLLGTPLYCNLKLGGWPPPYPPCGAPPVRCSLLGQLAYILANLGQPRVERSNPWTSCQKTLDLSQNPWTTPPPSI